MGDGYSKQNAIHSPNVDGRALRSLRNYLLDYNPPRGHMDHINILLFGMCEAGKSATINTILSALDQERRTINCVTTGINPDSLTLKLEFYSSNSLRFWDSSGWNTPKDAAQKKKLLTMILEGRVPAQTNLKEFNPDLDDGQYPVIPENKIHGVAFIFNINILDNTPMHLIEHFQELQTIVAQKNVYRIVIGTNIDHLGVPEKYYHLIYNYKQLQKKFQKLSAETGMEERTMFAVANEWKGDTIDQTRCVLILYALENMVRNIDKYIKVTQ
uniref:interferon-induced protein 44-like n=1 Tax=Pristiophorus japonicus TaxID=55135 RepID=UPI00398E3630